jgi:iron(III) transport system substrate-binding protein
MRARRPAALLAVSLSVALGLAACGGSSSGDPGPGDSGKAELTLYNAQHEDLMQLMVNGFEKKTGISVQMRNGDDFEMANQLVQEGDKTPADVFVTENSPAMTLVASKGGFSTVDKGTLGNVPSTFVPSDHRWVGFAGRSTVLAWNTQQLKAADLPTSILDLAQPKWKGKVGFSPSGADFQAIVSAVLKQEGAAKTEAWLKGLKTNGKIYDGNSTVMKAVNSGEIQVGVIYHYYWFKDQAESGANSNHVQLKYFGHQDPGAFFSISGAGVLKASKHQQEAQEFVAYLPSPAGQKILAESAAMEYPLNPKVAPNPKLKPINELDAPTIDPSTLNGPKVVELMQQAGLL